MPWFLSTELYFRANLEKSIYVNTRTRLLRLENCSYMLSAALATEYAFARPGMP